MTIGNSSLSSCSRTILSLSCFTSPQLYGELMANRTKKASPCARAVLRKSANSSWPAVSTISTSYVLVPHSTWGRKSIFSIASSAVRMFTSSCTREAETTTLTGATTTRTRPNARKQVTLSCEILVLLCTFNSPPWSSFLLQGAMSKEKDTRKATIRSFLSATPIVGWHSAIGIHANVAYIHVHPTYELPADHAYHAVDLASTTISGLRLTYEINQQETVYTKSSLTYSGIIQLWRDKKKIDLIHGTATGEYKIGHKPRQIHPSSTEP